MKAVKKIAGGIVGLFLLYLLCGFVWSVLNVQSCSRNLPNNSTCEQIAENDAMNCKYIILRWKKVSYDQELKECKDWEKNHSN